MRDVEKTLLTKENYLLSKILKDLKQDPAFRRFYGFVRKAGERMLVAISPAEFIELLHEAVQTWSVLRHLNPDPYLAGVLFIQTKGNFTLLEQFFTVSKESKGSPQEGFLLNEMLQKNIFTNINPQEGDEDLLRKTHTSSPKGRRGLRGVCAYKGIQVRVPKKLLDAIDALGDENDTRSSVTTELLLNADKTEPEKVKEFNLHLKEKYPEFFKNKKTVGFNLLVPAHLRLKVYLNKVGGAKRVSNRERELIGVSGLLWYLIFQKYPTLKARLGLL